MNLIQEYNKRLEPMRVITGEAMRIHRKFRPGLMESAYEAAMQYLLTQKGMKVERQVYLPIFWDNVQLDQSYRMDLMINGNIICELKAVSLIQTCHRRQLFNYMNLTHQPYGMLINFGASSLYSEWYRRHPDGQIEKIKLF